jgi:hypothetical protein
MSFTGKLLSFAGLSSLAVSAAFAQSLPPSVAACTAEKDSLARLVCFDREVAKYTQSSTRVAPTPSASAKVSPSAATVVPTQPPVASQPADEFGVAGQLARKRKAEKEDAGEAVKELHASVSKLSNKPYGEFVVTLDNGQVWQQNEAKSSFVIKEGETVIIKPAKFGSFMLTTGSGATTRVHRIQ